LRKEAADVTEVDARGLSCPLPVMRTQEALVSEPAEIVVLADSGTAKTNVESVLMDSGYAVTIQQGPDGYRILGKRS
jgi:tRNA 2-thiouridine synthesizing protein A